MTDSKPDPHLLQAPWAPVLEDPSSRRPQQRVRLSMYLAFAALALAVALQGAITWHLESMRGVDARLLEHAAEKRLLALQIGQQADLMLGGGTAPPLVAEELRHLLQTAAARALTMGAELKIDAGRLALSDPAVSASLEAWHTARELLWYRAESLLRVVDLPQGSGQQEAALALRVAASEATVAAGAMTAQIRMAAEGRAGMVRRGLALGMATLLVLLGVLSLAVVEPTARAVSRFFRRQQQQAAEMRSLALVAEHTSALVLITDRQDRIVWANPAFGQMTGWSLAEIVGRVPAEFLHDEAADAAALARCRDALVRGVGIRETWLNRTRDGHALWLDVDMRPLRNGAGELQGFVSVSTDVTLQVLHQAKLQALWSVLPAGVVVFNNDHAVAEANREAERLLGLSLAQIRGSERLPKGWRLLREDESDYPLRELAALRTMASGEPVRNETMGVRMPDGSLRWLLVNTEAQVDSAGRVAGVVACLSDITERRRLLDQLHDHARTDALTRLPNRAAVVERLQQAIAHAVRHPGYGFALLFMDFDRFKQVNDTLGHGAGDELLRQIAARLQLALRPGDQLGRLEPLDGSPQDVAARLGGDEFVVVLEGVNHADAVAAVADRVLKELSEPYLIGCTPLQSSASIGVVLYQGVDVQTGPPPTAEEVLRDADTAMYEAKRAGRGRWVMFDSSMHERVVRALAMEADLRRALARDEIYAVYQPVVDLETRAIVGVEALARWQHPERGAVPPAEFVPVAEEAGLIDTVGNLVLRKACQQFVRWRRELGERAPALLAVNLSRAQLKRPGMVDELAGVLRECAMEPAWLQLEVTESLAAQDEPVQATLRQLKALGLRLALDDFGTGYSSLACLHQLPVDTVKVDRSFVAHAQMVEYHRVLIEATVRVAHALGMTTVAEGIETEGQATLMLELQCSRGQGFLFSRPLAAPALEALLTAETPVPA